MSSQKQKSDFAAPFADEIRKTGFVLENKVAQHLKSAGWTVISNKYYVDDTEENVREIDLIAYKCSKVQHFNIYTVVIVSCKKSDSNIWALLSRKINLSDPNANFRPLHNWSNDKAISYQMAEVDFNARYYKRVAELGVKEVLQEPSVEVFAYQEMAKASGKPQNDKAIFSSITSLMKAQSYEISSLPARKKTPCIYQFNLLTVVDTEILRLMFNNDEITPSRISDEHYLASYIVRKKETFSRIRFLRSDVFSEALEDYGRLHLANCKLYAEEVDRFYHDLVKSSSRSKVFESELRDRINIYISIILGSGFGEDRPLSLWWDNNRETLNIGIDLMISDIVKLNSSDRLKAKTKSALKEIYRYDGEFEFSEDIPF